MKCKTNCLTHLRFREWDVSNVEVEVSVIKVGEGEQGKTSVAFKLTLVNMDHFTSILVKTTRKVHKTLYNKHAHTTEHKNQIPETLFKIFNMQDKTYQRYL